MSEEKILEIIEKYLAGNASAEEITQLDKWYDSAGCQKDLYEANSPELTQAVEQQFGALKAKLGIM